MVNEIRSYSDRSYASKRKFADFQGEDKNYIEALKSFEGMEYSDIKNLKDLDVYNIVKEISENAELVQELRKPAKKILDKWTNRKKEIADKASKHAQLLS